MSKRSLTLGGSWFFHLDYATPRKERQFFTKNTTGYQSGGFRFILVKKLNNHEV
jgi:hypothetical protein